MSLLTDLISYWKLDEASGTRFDSHGTNDLTDNNTVGSAAGKIGNAASFVAANSEYLSLSGGPILTGADGFTLSLWLYVDTAASGAYQVFFAADNGATFHGYVDPSGNVKFEGPGFSGVISGGAVSDGTWNHILYKYDAGLHYIRLNGAAAVSGNPTDLTSGSGGFEFAQRSGFSGRLTGRIDETGLWNRPLTTAEEDSLYNGGAGFAYPFVTGTGPTAIVPAIWLEGDGTYWQDSARTTAANADTDPVGAWDDASGAGQHAVQATSGSRPTLQTAEVNGVSAVAFDGVDDMLTSPAAVADGTPVTIAAVFRLTADGSFSYVLGDVSSFRGIRVTSGRTISLCDGAQDIASPTPIAGDWVVVVAILDGTNATLRVNGVQMATAASTVTGWIGGFTVGGQGTGANFQACQVAEPLLYDQALTGTDLTDVEDYLTAKYFAAGGTFTAALAATAGAATFSGSAEFDAPVYDGTLSATAAPASFSGSAQGTTPIYTGTLAASTGAAAFAGSATFEAPVYTGQLTAAAGPASFAGSAEFDAPVYDGELDATAGPAAFAGVATFDESVSIGTLTLTSGAAQFAGTATFTAGDFWGRITTIAATDRSVTTIPATDRSALTIPVDLT